MAYVAAFATLTERIGRQFAYSLLQSGTVESEMDKDRIKGTATNLKGKVKEAAGKVTGDAKLKTEGKTDQVAGKLQNAVGGAKDAIRDAVRKT